MGSLINSRSHFLKTGLALICLALFITLVGPTLLASTLINRGMILLVNHLVESPRRVNVQYPYSGLLASSYAGARATELAETAATIDSDNPITQWFLARVALMNGDYQRSVEALQLLLTAQHPLIYQNLTAALVGAGNPTEVIKISEAMSATALSVGVADAALLANLRIAESYLNGPDSEMALPYLETALSIEPYNLWANWHLLTTYTEKPTEGIRYKERLQGFPVSSVLATGNDLQGFANEAIIALYGSGIWESSLTERVVGMLVWQRPDERTAVLINSLAAIDGSGVWESWFAELNERQLYDQQLALSGNPTQVKVRPDDPSVLTNGGFERVQAGSLIDWQIADYATALGNPIPTAAFFAAPDLLQHVAGQYSARIDGLWKGLNSTPGFYGFVTFDQRYGSYAVVLEPSRRYSLSGYLRTTSAMERVSIYLGSPDVTVLEELLEPTTGQWQPFEFTFCGVRDQGVRVQLLLQLRSEGRVWFDALELRELTGSDESEDVGLCP